MERETVKRNVQSFPITNFTKIKEQLLYWANQFDSCSFLDNNCYPSAQSEVECRVGVGAFNSCSPTDNHQQQLKKFLETTNDWLFGHISYEYKNVLHNSNDAKSLNLETGFELIRFFQPEIVILLYLDKIEIQTIHADTTIVFNDINNFLVSETSSADIHVSLVPKISKEEYLNSIRQIQKHIVRGDCYEINFCQEFVSADSIINPLAVFQRLTLLSPNPFSCYYKIDNNFLLCASPERYLKKEGNKLISQPIKGTFKRNITNREIDESLKQQLLESEKERAENVMIVDLIRNDLSKICKESTVEVSELFGIYSFPNVHQMISTIVGTIDDSIDFSKILEATFPMGSMTGAPKKRVMELINQYEVGTRGLYSGTVGYISPEKDFDFNVVIRSILYNETNKQLSYQVGSGITHYSNPESEYEECLLKAASIRESLKNK